MNNNLLNNGFIPNQELYHNNQSSYVEGYLKGNIGKKIELHASFCDSIEWRDSVFTGVLHNVGKDYVVLRDRQNDYIIWSIYIDYIIITNN